MYKSHYCIVFELLGTDIRARISEKLFSLDEIKKYAIQLFIGLHALRKHKLVHADIKPDNLLFSTDK
jgi:serine/threonine-protein kinase PRP4